MLASIDRSLKARVLREKAVHALYLQAIRAPRKAVRALYRAHYERHNR
jgi:hypothetical protein